MTGDRVADPAVEAAERAWDQRYGNGSLSAADSAAQDGIGHLAIAAAREALAPLRAKHQRVQRPDGSWRCTSCRDAYGGHADFPTGTDLLIYREDEL